MTFLQMNGSTPGEGSGRSENMGASERILPFIDLVFECQAVAVGSVTDISGDGTDGQPRKVTVAVERSFQRELPPKISITVVQGGLGQEMSLDMGESYLLFLTNLHGSEANLMGNGDMGKWPRLKADWKYSQGHVQPLEEVAKVVEEIVRIDAVQSYGERASALHKLSQRSDLGLIATLQYTADSRFWPTRQDDESDVTPKLVGAFIALTTALIDRPLDYAVHASQMQLLATSPRLVGLSGWILALGNTEVAIRDDALAALSTVTEEDFGFDSRASEGERSAGLDRWHEWLERRRPELMRQEVPQLIEKLASENDLERTVADLALRVIAGTEMGFESSGQEVVRNEAAKRWDAWWQETESGLSR